MNETTQGNERVCDLMILTCVMRPDGIWYTTSEPPQIRIMCQPGLMTLLVELEKKSTQSVLRRLGLPISSYLENLHDFCFVGNAKAKGDLRCWLVINSITLLSTGAMWFGLF